MSPYGKRPSALAEHGDLYSLFSPSATQLDTGERTDLFGISSKVCNILLNPLQSEALVEITQVRGYIPPRLSPVLKILRVEESKSIQSLRIN